MANKKNKNISKGQKARNEKLEIERKQSIFKIGAGIFVLLLLGMFIFVQSDSDKGEGVKIYGDDVIEMSYFHYSRCSHCIVQNKYNKFLKVKYPNLKIIEYEISNASVLDIYKDYASQIEGLDPDKFPGTPLTIFMQTKEFNIGYGSDDTTGKKISSIIKSINDKINENWDASTMKRTINSLEE